MAKYDYNFKLKVVMSYMNGEGGYCSLAKKYDIPNKYQVRKWVNAYKAFGKDGLKTKDKHTNYTIQFKLDVLNYMIRNNCSERETANIFGLNDYSIISSWKKKFSDGGVKALERTKGRTSMNKDKSENKALTREQQLEHENQLLKAELAFLKKLRALRMDIPERLKDNAKQK